MEILQLTEGAAQLTDFDQSLVVDARSLSVQLDSVATEIRELEERISLQGRTAESDGIAKQLLAQLARQRADAQVIAQKSEETETAAAQNSVDDAQEAASAAKEQFMIALRVIIDTQSRLTQLARRLSGNPG